MSARTSPHNPYNPPNARLSPVLRMSRILRAVVPTRVRPSSRGPPEPAFGPIPRRFSRKVHRMASAEVSVTTNANDNQPVAEPIRLVLTIEQAARRLGIGRTLMYSLVMSGEVESVTIGRLRRIPVECLAEYVAKLRDSEPAAKAA
jgi:excisionase family DNA binding protein